MSHQFDFCETCHETVSKTDLVSEHTILKCDGVGCDKHICASKIVDKCVVCKEIDIFCKECFEKYGNCCRDCYTPSPEFGYCELCDEVVPQAELLSDHIILDCEGYRCQKEVCDSKLVDGCTRCGEEEILCRECFEDGTICQSCEYDDYEASWYEGP